MYRFEPFIKYEYNGRIYENSKLKCDNYSLELSINDDGIQCTLAPNVKMKLIEFSISVQTLQQVVRLRSVKLSVSSPHSQSVSPVHSLQ